MKKMQKVFPIYGINNARDFKNSLQSRQEQSLSKRNFDYELKEMDANGLSRNAINDIFSCIEERDAVES